MRVDVRTARKKKKKKKEKLFSSLHDDKKSVSRKNAGRTLVVA